MATTPITIVDDFSTSPRTLLGATSDGQASWNNLYGSWGSGPVTLSGIPTQNMGYYTVYGPTVPNSAGEFGRSGINDGEILTFVPPTGFTPAVITPSIYLVAPSTNAAFYCNLILGYLDNKNIVFWHFVFNVGLYSWTIYPTYINVNSISGPVPYVSPSLNAYFGTTGQTSFTLPSGLIAFLSIAIDLAADILAANNLVNGGWFGFHNTKWNANSIIIYLSKVKVTGTGTVVSINTGYQHMWANNPDQRAGMYNVNTNTSDRGGLWNNLRS
jgi:hypothetical protein